MASSGTSTSWIDFFPLILIVLAGIMIMLAGRKKMLKCPECGNVFAAPAFDSKRSGSGWTLPYLGQLKCSKCGQSRGRRDYKTLKVKQTKFTGVLPQAGSPSP
ncbi:MAG: hypothetical protein OK442_00065 [Thaumarchaeota archaeon]|nr:hypothetical protein [Nitrososphaerota archaeon]